jgi:lipid-A-disaccharide synthase
MRVFVSAGEPSGDLHGANLAHALRAATPGVEVVGLGGERMAAAGCNLLFPLTQLAVTGVFRALGSLRRFKEVLDLADRDLRRRRPDALVLIDFPGFHWHLARRAKARGVPVVYFVPPQLWGWAGWRHRKMRRLTDLVLCCLPFEGPWYRRRHVPVRYVGHPYFDELPAQCLDAPFLWGQKARPGTVIALLPGSRRSEIELNAPSLLRAAEIIHGRRPDVRFLVACLKDEHRRRLEEMMRGTRAPVEAHAGRTPEIIELAHSCLSVSGSVGLELLYRGKPSVVVYREGWFHLFLAHLLKTAPYISLVNLLAGRELFPEWFGRACPAEWVAAHALRWLDDPGCHEALRDELRELRARVAVPGACARAAAAVLEVAGAARRASGAA